MGIFRDLVGNFAQSKMQEQQQKLAQNLAWGDILTTLIKNPETDDATFQKASTLYHSLLGKEGGKHGKELQGQIAQLLGAYGAHRRLDREARAAGDTQPDSGQTPEQPGGMNYGWPTTPAVPSTLSGTGADGAQAGRQPPPPGAVAQPGGFRRFLGGLAGVGKEMMGVPRDQGGMIPTRQQIQDVYGPSEVGLAEEKERGALAAGRLERDEYVRQQKADEAAGIQSAQDTQENIREYDRGGRPPGARATRNLSMGEQAFELAKASLAQKLKKPVDKLTFDEQRDALAQSVEDSRAVPENRREDNDALDAYAQTLAQKDPNREKTLGRPMTRADLTAHERLDGRMAWAKQKAMRGETMPSDIELYKMVKYDLMSGHTTAMGMGANDPFRRAYINMRAKVINEEGPGRIADMSAGYRSDQAALTNLQKIDDAMTGWEEATKKNLEQVRLLSKQVGRTGSTLWNEYQQLLQGKLETYPELTKFKIAVETGTAEYTRVMYSATPSGVTTDDQKKASRDMLATGFSDGNVDAAIDQMYIDMGNRKTGMDDQIDRIHARIEASPTPGGRGGRNLPTITDPKDKDKLPSGTLYRDPQGNIRRKK